jgi:hypothetical protein
MQLRKSDQPWRTHGGFSAKSLIQDVKFGMRLLRNSPGFTLVAVLTLALGIGVNTAVFSAVDTVLLRPLPYVHPEQLLLVSEVLPKLGGDEVGVAAGEYLDYRDRNRSFAQVAAYQNDGFNLTGAGTPLRINADRAAASLFPLLGVRPAVGRTFTDEEARQGAAAVVVIAHDLWQRQYGGDFEVLGKTIKLDEKPYTIIGVMPASFRFPSDSAPASERVQVWVPLSTLKFLVTNSRLSLSEVFRVKKFQSIRPLVPVNCHPIDSVTPGLRNRKRGSQYSVPLAEEWNHQFFEANPSRECDEKPEHAEEHNCRSFVWPLGKWW